MKRLLKRCKIQWTDHLTFSPLVRRALCERRLRAAGTGRSSSSAETASRIQHLCAAARLATSEAQLRAVEARIRQVLDGSSPLDPAELLEGDTEKRIPKSLILKPFDSVTGEPGVVFISFEDQWRRLLLASNLDEFARRYLLVVSPTWTPPHSLVNCAFPRFFPAPIYCLISNVTDLETFPRLSDQYRMVDLLASSWVDPDLFRPWAREDRDIDLIMLANFGTYKRHHVLFEALRHLPESWRVVLVGQPNGARTAEVLFAEAEAFGVRDRFELRQRVSDAEVVDALCRARMSLICSRREGSCVAVVESMFADTPVVLLEGAQIGSARFINRETGIFLPERSLAAGLKRFHEESATCRSRAWCLEQGIDARSSVRRLNEFLREESERRGLPWTRDILLFHWRPNPVPLDAPDVAWLGDEVDSIRRACGVLISPTPVAAPT